MNRLSRVDKLAIIGGTIVTLTISAPLYGVVWQNYQMMQRYKQIEADIRDEKAKAAKLQQDIDYYKTNSYRDKAAREKLGLQAPGESVVITP